MKNIYTPELTGIDFANAIAANGRKMFTAAMYSAIQAHTNHAHQHPNQCKCTHGAIIEWANENLDLMEQWPGVGPKRLEALITLGSTGPDYWQTLCVGAYRGRNGHVMHKPRRNAR